MASASSPGGEEAVVRIEHMNDGPGYLRLLRKWARDLDLVLNADYQPAPKPNRPHRLGNVLVTLHGDSSDVSDFLLRLRTQLVDVDSRGNRCKEKQSTVLRRTPKTS